MHHLPLIIFLAVVGLGYLAVATADQNLRRRFARRICVITGASLLLIALSVIALGCSVRRPARIPLGPVIHPPILHSR